MVIELISFIKSAWSTLKAVTNAQKRVRLGIDPNYQRRTLFTYVNLETRSDSFNVVRRYNYQHQGENVALVHTIKKSFDVACFRFIDSNGKNTKTGFLLVALPWAVSPQNAAESIIDKLMQDRMSSACWLLKTIDYIMKMFKSPGLSCLSLRNELIYELQLFDNISSTPNIDDSKGAFISRFMLNGYPYGKISFPIQNQKKREYPRLITLECFSTIKDLYNRHDGPPSFYQNERVRALFEYAVNNMDKVKTALRRG